MTELHKFINHLIDSGVGEQEFSKETWLAIIDYFYKKDTTTN